MNTNEQNESVFGSIIHAYTRAQAIEDGTLYEVDAKTSREVGIRYPVALTAAVYAECVAWNTARNGTEQDESGRLWDVLWMTRNAMRRTQGSECEVRVYVRDAGAAAPTLRTLKCVCGPGDDLEPVLTVMLPEED